MECTPRGCLVQHADAAQSELGETGEPGSAYLIPELAPLHFSNQLRGEALLQLARTGACILPRAAYTPARAFIFAGLAIWSSLTGNVHLPREMHELWL